MNTEAKIYQIYKYISCMHENPHLESISKQRTTLGFNFFRIYVQDIGKEKVTSDYALKKIMETLVLEKFFWLP